MDTPQSKDSEQMAIPEKRNTDVEVLKAQVKSLQDGDKRIIEAFKICATVLLGVTLLVAGYSWYNNKFNYDRDRAAILREVVLSNDKQLIDIQKHLDEALEKSKIQLEIVASNQIADSLFRMNALMATNQALMQSTFDKHQKELNEKIAVVTLISSQFDTNIGSINKKIQGAYSLSEGAVFLDQCARLFSLRQYADSAASGLIAAKNYLLLDRQKLGTALAITVDCFKKMKTSEFDKEVSGRYWEFILEDMSAEKDTNRTAIVNKFSAEYMKYSKFGKQLKELKELKEKN
ncbi:MAG: hypothetical protein JWQ71_1737 [Pedosphaera sp.]|nr:hypothetical protein [Pedosphaera sp.]